LTTLVYNYRIQGTPQPIDVIEEHLAESHFYLNELKKIGIEQRAKEDAFLHQAHPKLQELKVAAAKAWADYYLLEESQTKLNQQDGRKGQLGPRIKATRDSAVQTQGLYWTMRKRLRKESLEATETSATNNPEYQSLVQELESIPEAKRGNNKEAKRLRCRLRELRDAVATNPIKALEEAANDRINELYHSSVNLSSSQKESLREDYGRSLGKGKLSIQGEDESSYVFTNSRKGAKQAIKVGDLFAPGKRRVPALFRLTAKQDVPITIILHRPLPPDANIRGVRLVRNRIATKEYWYVQFIIKTDRAVVGQAANSESVGFDLGWRRLPEGLHVVSYSGKYSEGSVVIPTNKLDVLDHIKAMQGVRDRVFNETVTMVREWAKTHSIPEWLKASLQYAHCWKSQRRLTKLIKRWERFVGDESVYTMLNGDGQRHPIMCKGTQRWAHLGWRSWDRHMDEQINQSRAKWIRWRDKFYEQEASRLSRVYGIFKFEDVKLNKLDRKASCEDESNDRMRRYKRYAAPGRLREIFKRRAYKWEEVESKGTTYTCDNCGHYIKFGALLEKVCPGCGLLVNRDKNASRIVNKSKKVTKSSTQKAA
jgi:hypothetical protein